MRCNMVYSASPSTSPTPISSVRTSIFFCTCPNNQRSICTASIYRLHQGGIYDADASSNTRESYPTSQMMNKMHILWHITRLWHLQSKQYDSTGTDAALEICVRVPYVRTQRFHNEVHFGHLLPRAVPVCQRCPKNPSHSTAYRFESLRCVECSTRLSIRAKYSYTPSHCLASMPMYCLSHRSRADAEPALCVRTGSARSCLIASAIASRPLLVWQFTQQRKHASLWLFVRDRQR